MVKEVKASKAVVDATKKYADPKGALKQLNDLKQSNDLQMGSWVGGRIGSAIGSAAGPVGKVAGKIAGSYIGRQIVAKKNKKAKGGMVSRFSSISKPQRFKGTF